MVIELRAKTMRCIVALGLAASCHSVSGRSGGDRYARERGSEDTAAGVAGDPGTTIPRAGAGGSFNSTIEPAHGGNADAGAASTSGGATANEGGRAGADNVSPTGGGMSRGDAGSDESSSGGDAAAAGGSGGSDSAAGDGGVGGTVSTGGAPNIENGGAGGDPAGGVEYSLHMAQLGWLDYVANGTQSGAAPNEVREVEAMKVRLRNVKPTRICYRVRVASIGWQNETCDDEEAGTTGFFLAIEAFSIRLLEPPPGCSVRYQGRFIDTDWSSGADNDILGLSTGGHALENVRIELTQACY